MVNVSMGQKQIVNIFRLHREGRERQLRITALGFAAVDKNIHLPPPMVGKPNQMTGTGYTLFCPKMGYFDRTHLLSDNFKHRFV
jgi:hypothetical protein